MNADWDTTMTLDDLKTAFTAAYSDLARMALACTPHNWGPERREEAVQEILAGTWRALQRRYVLGHVTAETFWTEVKSVLYFQTRQVLSGRMMPENAAYGMQGEHHKDVFDKGIKINIGLTLQFVVPDAAPVPDQVAFRVDMLAFFDTLTGRDRDIIACMIAGLTTTEIAERFGVTPGRIIAVSDPVQGPDGRILR